MPVYNPDVLQQYANRLYSRANGIMVAFTLLSLGIGGIGGGVLGLASSGDLSAAAPNFDSNMVPILLAVGAFAGVVVGFILGSGKAFTLKLQAQQALCQRQIELNTRPASAPR